MSLPSPSFSNTSNHHRSKLINYLTVKHLIRFLLLVVVVFSAAVVIEWLLGQNLPYKKNKNKRKGDRY